MVEVGLVEEVGVDGQAICLDYCLFGVFSDVSAEVVPVLLENGEDEDLYLLGDLLKDELGLTDVELVNHLFTLLKSFLFSEVSHSVLFRCFLDHGIKITNVLCLDDKKALLLDLRTNF